MANRFVFADEAGNFDFSRNRGATRYFILTTVTLTDPAVGLDLIRLRHEMLADGTGPNRSHFHASEDQQPTRNRVFAVLAKHDFRIDVTILEKSKSQPQVRQSDAAFYKHAWFYHLKHVAPKLVTTNDMLVVIGSSLGSKKKQKAFRAALESVVQQVGWHGKTRVVFWPASCDPCLEVADYCCWAIQRKWESGGADLRSHGLIAGKIATEFDLFRNGTKNYY